MSSEQQPQRRQRRRFVWLCLATAALLLLFLGIFLSGLPFFDRRLSSDIGLLAGGLAAAVSCGLRIRDTVGHRRQAWLFLALAGLSAAIGNGWVLIVHLTNFSDTAASYGDIGFVAALLLGIVALILFPAVKRRGLDLARILFDGSVVGGSLLSIVGVTVFPTLLGQAGSNTRIVSLLTTVVDVVIATLAAMLVIRGARSDRTVLIFLGTGSILYAVSDLARSALAAQHAFAFGGPVDIGWITGYAAFALAARYPSGSDSQSDAVEAAATPAQVSSALTFGAFLIAAIVRVTRLPSTGSSYLTSAIWVAVLLAVTIRQALLVIDNESLRRDLERRVTERTGELQSLTRASQTMLDSVGDGIYGVDPGGRITFANPSAVQLLGFEETELIGADAHQTFHAPAPDGTPYPYAQCYIDEAIRQGAITTSEDDVYRRHDGREIPVEVTASPLVRDDVVEGAVVVFRDVTQRREVDRLKSEFVSVVSHELRTPLTSIRGSLGLLSAGALGELSPAATRMVKIALDSSERLTRLINDILDIERIESGTMPMEMNRVYAGELIRTAVDQVNPIAVEAGVRLWAGAGAAECWVWADPDRIVQTLVNLIGNAIKFSDRNSVVEIDAGAPAGTDPALVTFRVQDQGRGIPADKLGVVFRRFEQADSSDVREKGGSGLGLAISRSIVERHGGEIWVDSVAGEGSTFSFTIPSAPQDPAHPETVDRPTILVCDDDPDFVEMISILLERRGYRAISAPDGRSAIRIAAKQPPRAIMLDLMMQGTDGAAVVSALRNDERTRELPIVIVSGLSPEDDREVAVRADDWLVRPVDEEQLSRTLSVSIAEQPIRGDVLLVGDDEATAVVIRTLLGRRGIRVTQAHSQREALTLLTEVEPEVLILDFQLPDGAGRGVADAIRGDPRLSDLPVVLYSASDVPAHQRADFQLDGTVFLTKGKTSPQSLEQRVVRLLDSVTGLERPAQAPQPDRVS